MTATQNLVGGVLIAGLVVFLVGAVAWRLAYEQALPEVLRVIHADRRRRAWIHLWMIPAVFLTAAGVAGFVALPDTWEGMAAAGMAVLLYALGALCWVISLAFRLTVVPSLAERVAGGGDPPDGFAALNAWMGALYVIHMIASYAAFAMLGVAVLVSDNLPHWAGWVGVVTGLGFLAEFVATRFAGPFNPPFLAHLYTGMLGVVVLAS